MKRKMRIAIFALVSAISGNAAFSECAGGIFAGTVQPGWNPGFMPATSSTMREIEYAGLSLDVAARRGWTAGFFALAFFDGTAPDYLQDSLKPTYFAADSHVVGGAGGVAFGRRIIGSDSIHLDAAAKIGAGGMYYATKYYWVDRYPESPTYGQTLPDFSPKAYLVFYAEPVIELSVAPCSWMKVSVELSYPVIGNFAPGQVCEDILLYSPAAGIVLSFGRF